MSRLFPTLIVAVLVTLVTAESTHAQRGFGGRRSGGFSGAGGIRRGGGINRRSGGGVSFSRAPTVYRGYTGGTAVPGGSQWGGVRPRQTSPSTTARSNTPMRSRTVTTQRGGSVTIAQARAAAAGNGRAGAASATGTKITTPGGRTITRGNAAAAAAGTRGSAVGAETRTGFSGPAGSAAASRSGAAARILGTDGGLARTRNVVGAAGTGGSVVSMHRTTAVANGTRHARALRVRANARGEVFYFQCFRPNWYARYATAWRPAGWNAWSVWYPLTWDQLCGWSDWYDSNQPRYYDYGNTIVYEGDVVYDGADRIAAADEYFEQATEIAEKGSADVSDEAEWRSLGVFGMVQKSDSETTKVLQIAVNAEGIVRGNYYDLLTDEVTPIAGAVDQRSQRAAWTVGSNPEVVYETGIYNLTAEESPMLVHTGNDQTEQWMLVKLEVPNDVTEEE